MVNMHTKRTHTKRVHTKRTHTKTVTHEADAYEDSRHEADAHEEGALEPNNHEEDGVKNPEPPSLSRRSTDPLDPQLKRPSNASNEPDAVPVPSATPADAQKGTPLCPGSQAARIVSPQEFRGYPKVS